MEDQEEDHAPGSPDASLDDANASIQDEESIANTSAGKGVNRKSSAGSLDSKLAKVPQYVPEKVTLETKSVIGGEEYLSRSTLVIVPARQGSDYCVGDLVWARIQGFCFWPAIITIDPVSGLSSKSDRIYHVQFFGHSPSRGWPSAGNFFPFEGYQKFYDRIKNEVEKLNSKQSAKVTSKYIVKSAMLKSWNYAVAEATEAMKLDHVSRIRLLTFDYVVKNEVKTPKATKRPLESASTSKAGTNSSAKPAKARKRNSTGKKAATSPEDVYNFNDDSDGEVMGKLTLKNRNAKGDFQVYLRKHFDDECKTNPKLTKAQVTTALKQKWTKMSEYERSFFVERIALFEDESNMLVAKRANLGDDYGYSDDDDDDFNDGNSNDGPGGLSNDQNGEGFSKANVAISKAKARKSEKLFDMIIDGAGTSKDDANAEEAATPTKTKRQSAARVRTPKPKPASKVEPTPTKTKSASKNGNVTGNSSPTKNSSKLLFVASGPDSDDNLDDSTPSTGHKTDDNICDVCYHSGHEKKQLIECSGDCHRYFHKKCIDLESEVQTFCCEECANDKYKCFECKKYETDESSVTIKCNVAGCNHYYHFPCIENYPIVVDDDNGDFRCPLHACNSCHAESVLSNETRDSIRKPLVRCIACPTAYHSAVQCIAAGSVKLADDLIICPNHYHKGQFLKKSDRLVNVNYCFTCNQASNALVYCEACPAAFHQNCLQQQYDVEKKFFCINCSLRRPLHYDDIVWGKFASYRWWPGKICNRNKIPENVANFAHNEGDFPVYFFGSHDYQWLNKGRTFRFDGRDYSNLAIDNKKSSNKNLAKLFEKAVQEATEAYNLREKSEKAAAKLVTREPRQYTTITSNCYPRGLNGNVNKVETPVCDCDPDEKNQFCGDNSCINRASLIECDPEVCPCGAACENQLFTKNEQVDVEYFRTENNGWGLRSVDEVKEGDFVIEYVGEIIDEQECEKRIKSTFDSNSYLLTLENDKIIDASRKGNLSRFINHSCDPNCVTQKWLVNNETRVGIFAIKDIPAGAEITINYDVNNFGDAHVKLKCVCGAHNCKGRVYDESRRSTVLCVSNGKLVTKRFISGPSKNGGDFEEVMKLDDDDDDDIDDNKDKIEPKAADSAPSSPSSAVNGETA